MWGMVPLRGRDANAGSWNARIGSSNPGGSCREEVGSTMIRGELERAAEPHWHAPLGVIFSFFFFFFGFYFIFKIMDTYSRGTGHEGSRRCEPAAYGRQAVGERKFPW